MIKMSDIYSYTYKEADKEFVFTYVIVNDGIVFIHPHDVIDYMDYKMTVWNEFTMMDFIEEINDICKEIGAFGEHNE